MTEHQIFYVIVQSLVFAMPVCGILIAFGRKLQKVENQEKVLQEHLKTAEEREHQRRGEIEKVYNRLNALSESVNYIKGKMERG